MVQMGSKLETINKQFIGNTLVKNRFHNEYNAAANNSFLRVLKWKFFNKNPQLQEAINDNFVPNVQNLDVLPKEQNRLVWLGHAAFLLDINGVRILLDPCLTELKIMKRKTTLPCKISEINPDIILITHGHYDHFDIKTLQQLKHDNMQIFMPLGLSIYLKDEHLRKQAIEMDWYQIYKTNGIEIIFLPASHWHSRYGYDKNRALWGSFAIRYADKQIYFCGDSGYNTHFKKIKELCGDMDICILPVGAYKPDYIMKHSHMNPYESSQAFKDLGGKTFVPMHYGTFTLSWEPASEGIEQAKELLGQNLQELNIGENFYI